MQTVDMGSTEATLTHIPTIQPPSSSSYYLQLDPSGQVDILESSLILNKPDMAEETVYEIQLDPFMDERNVEMINLQNIQNLQNLQGSYTFQPEYYQVPVSTPAQPQYATSVTYEPQQVQFQIDDVNFNQLLFSNNVTFLPSAPAPVPTVQAEQLNIQRSNEVLVPDFAVETEVVEETGVSNSDLYNSDSFSVQSKDTLPRNVPQVKDTTDADLLKTEAMEKETEEIEWDDEPETMEKPVEPQIVVKREPMELPDNIMEFTEEAVIPPLVEITPNPFYNLCKQPDSISVIDISHEDEESSSSENKALIPAMLHDGMDPDDELYISYYSRPDPSKTSLCILCYDWFESPEDLEVHLKSVHQDNMKLYACKRCGKQFWSRFLRHRHEKTHRYDLKGPIKRYCPKDRPFDHFESKHFLKRLRPAPFTEEYRERLKILHSQIKSMEFECIECNKEFSTEEEYREHREEFHVLQTCVSCSKTFDNAKLLRIHEKEFHGKVTFEKNYEGGAWKLWENSWDCDEMKERENRLLNVCLYHNYSKRANNDALILNDNCDNFLALDYQEITVTANEAHRIVESGKSTDKPRKSRGKSKGKKTQVIVTHANGTTELSSRTKDLGIKMDYSDLMEGEPPYSCEECRTVHNTEAEYQRHLKTHTIRSMAYMCQYCGRGFATHSNRKEHERIHTGDKPYVCPSKSEERPSDVCQRAFVQISNLKKHIQTHKDKNNLQCSTCQKQFVKESSLILHQRAHSQDRKFRCHVCDRAYNYASLLKRHMRIHTGENPYSCEDCGMMFHELVSLHYHRKKVHTGERPHRCEECGRAFILSSDLKKHIKIHERDGPGTKPSPAKTYSRKSRVSADAPSTSTKGAYFGSSAMDSNGSFEAIHENDHDMDDSNDNDAKYVLPDEEEEEEDRLVINESDSMLSYEGKEEVKYSNGDETNQLTLAIDSITEPMV